MMIDGTIANGTERGRDGQVQTREHIAVLAHDLRNLLTPLRNRMDLIARRAAREDRARDLRDASEAILAIERLHQLIADLLDAERLEQELFALRRTPVDLVALTRETAGLLHDTTEIRVHASSEANILADPSKLRQALEDLITNAVQHWPPGKPVAVTVEAERQAGAQRAIVTIADQGLGIPPERMPFLFKCYQSGNGSNVWVWGFFLRGRSPGRTVAR